MGCSFTILANPNASGRAPWYEERAIGKSTVAAYDDIHLLFDAKLFGFEDGKPTVKLSPELKLNKYYRELLSGKSLPTATYNRVAEALAQRKMR